MTRIDLRRGGTPRNEKGGTGSSEATRGGTGGNDSKHPQSGTPKDELPEVLTVREAAAAAGVSVQAFRRRIARGTISSTTLHQGREEVTAVERAELLRAYSKASAAKLRAVLGTGATGEVPPQAPVATPGVSTGANPQTKGDTHGGLGGVATEGLDLAKLQTELHTATRKAAEALAKLEAQRERAAQAEGRGKEHASARRAAEQALEAARQELVEARERQATAEGQSARVADLEARAERAEHQADQARQEAQGLTLTLMSAQKRILELESPTVEAGALGPVARQLEALDQRTRWDPLAKMALGGLIVAVGGLAFLYHGTNGEVLAAKSEAALVRSRATGLESNLSKTQEALIEAQKAALETERRAIRSESSAQETQSQLNESNAKLRSAERALQAHVATTVLRDIFGF